MLPVTFGGGLSISASEIRQLFIKIVEFKSDEFSKGF